MEGGVFACGGVNGMNNVSNLHLPTYFIHFASPTTRAKKESPSSHVTTPTSSTLPNNLPSAPTQLQPRRNESTRMYSLLCVLCRLGIYPRRQFPAGVPLKPKTPAVNRQKSSQGHACPVRCDTCEPCDKVNRVWSGSASVRVSKSTTKRGKSRVTAE